MTRTLRPWTGLLAAFALALALPAAASAGTVGDLYVLTASGAGDGTCDATCTLGDAIDDSNTTTGLQTIKFMVGGAVVNPPVGGFPAITEQVIIDGTSQPGVKLDGLDQIGVGPGLTLSTSNSTIKGLRIEDFPGGGIVIQGSQNLIGVTDAGNQFDSNGDDAIQVVSGSGNTFRGNTILNSGTAIDLTAGTNNDQPAPTITSPKRSDVGMRVHVSMVGGTAFTTYRFEFFSSGSCTDDAESVLATFDAAADAIGAVDFTETIPVTPGYTGQSFNATATSLATGSTSELSGCVDAGTADITGPGVAFSSGPTGPTNDTTPSFTFTSSATDFQRFECSLDGAGFAPCGTSSPGGFTAPSPLSDGPHSLAVKAYDDVLKTSQATRNFTVDTVAPDTSITSGPSGTVTTAQNIFSFGSNELGVSFQCRSDGASFAACAPPLTVGPLALGPHSFEVRATDMAGNQDGSAASRSYTIAAPPPPPPPPPPVVPPPPPPAPEPEFGKGVVADGVSGKVYYRDSSGELVELTDAKRLNMGVTIDATEGSVRLITAAPDKKTQSGVFNGGIFKVTQPRSEKGLAQLALTGTELSECAVDLTARASARRGPSRKQFGNAKGKFRTRGKHSAATVRGTRWEVTDLCDRTVTRVRSGVVVVRDFARKRNVTVRRGKSYTARPRRR